MRVLGIDFGTKRVGLAMGDTETNVAVPRETIAADNASAVLVVLCREERIERVIVGLPLTMAGEEGEMASRARAFGARLKKETGLPVEYIDERLTSKLSTTDAGAAAAILQTWLDRRRAAEPPRNKKQ